MRASRQPGREGKAGWKSGGRCRGKASPWGQSPAAPSRRAGGRRAENWGSQGEREPGWRAVPGPSPCRGPWQRLLPAFGTPTPCPKPGCREVSGWKRGHGRPARTGIHPRRMTELFTVGMPPAGTTPARHPTRLRDAFTGEPDRGWVIHLGANALWFPPAQHTLQHQQPRDKRIE